MSVDKFVNPHFHAFSTRVIIGLKSYYQDINVDLHFSKETIWNIQSRSKNHRCEHIVFANIVKHEMLCRIIRLVRDHKTQIVITARKIYRRKKNGNLIYIFIHTHTQKHEKFMILLQKARS